VRIERAGDAALVLRGRPALELREVARRIRDLEEVLGRDERGVARLVLGAVGAVSLQGQATERIVDPVDRERVAGLGVEPSVGGGDRCAEHVLDRITL
jgi:hypothetical protein